MRSHLRFKTLLCVLSLLGFYRYHETWQQVPFRQQVVRSQYFQDTVFYADTKRIGLTNHFDYRFAPTKDLPYDMTQRTLLYLLQSFEEFMSRLEIHSWWIAHGTLLGWYWNKKLLPWDTDIDIQMTFESLDFLSKNNNMSLFYSDLSNSTFLLDTNMYLHTLERDLANSIDARWIDTSTGKYIDITAVHTDPSLPRVICKDGHYYNVSYEHNKKGWD
jgi:hypothetical protein